MIIAVERAHVGRTTLCQPPVLDMGSPGSCGGSEHFFPLLFYLYEYLPTSYDLAVQQILEKLLD